MSISAASAVRVLLVAVLLCAAPNGWSKTPKVKGNRKLVWVGLAVAGAGAAVFATAGHTVTTPQQCALVPLATICIPPKTYTDYRQQFARQEGSGKLASSAPGFTQHVKWPQKASA
jgi:hypothetical protein